MTTSTYSGLMNSLLAPEGSEMHERLQKLQELEQMRKEREAMRQQRLQQNSENSGSRFRRTRSTNQEYSTPYTTYSASTNIGLSDIANKYNPFESSSTYNYGARPKQSGYSNSSGSDNLSDIFSNITSEILGKNRYGSNNSSSYSSSRRRPALGEYSSSSSQYDQPYQSDRNDPARHKSYYRSISDNQTESVFGDSSDRSYTSRARRRGGRSHVNEYSNENGSEQEGHDENNTTEDDSNVTVTETIEFMNYPNNYEEEEEEEEEPKHFIERLKNGSPVHSKRGVGNDHVIGTIPSIPPFKRQKPGGDPDPIDPLDDDIIEVAKDIRSTFGIKSPKSGDSQTTERHFEFSSSKEDLSGGSRNNGEFVFTAKSSEEKSKQYSSNKRKPRRSLRNSKDNLNNDRHSSNVVNSENNETADESVVYHISELQDDGDDDEAKQLPVSDAFNKSGWLASDNTPGKLDEMHEYFAGTAVNGDPVIDRVLDGSGVRRDLEKSFTQNNAHSSNERSRMRSPEQQKGAFTTLKSAFNNLVQFDGRESTHAASNSDSTPEKEETTSKNEKKTSMKGTPKANGKNKKNVSSSSSKKDTGKHKVIEKVKAANRSSDSDNDSFQTASESESDYKNSRRASGASTPTRSTTDSSKNGGKAKSDMSLTLSDKLAKLETMTQEKKRKHSATELEGKKPVPSYMSGTSASQSKSRAKSPAGLAKDVRELKKFVHEHTSEANTPVHSSRKETTAAERTPKKTIVMKEIATQTDPKASDAISQVYVCIHCGKSSDQKVDPAVSDATTDGEDTESLDRYETRSETGYNLRSSKSSIKSSTPKWTFGKNEHRKAPTASKSYMKGTTSSSLKTNNDSEKARKGSVPEVVYNYKSEEGSKSKKGKNIVAQRAKELDIAAKKGEQKRMAFAAQRASSSDRNKATGEMFFNEKSKLGKAKSVDQMNFIKSKPERTVNIDIETSGKDINSNDISKSPEIKDVEINKAVASLGEKRDRSQLPYKSPERECQSFSRTSSGATEISKDVSPTASKPPVVAPKPKRPAEDAGVAVSPTKSDEVFETAVESKGQFTRLENNPFIRNDLHRRNSLKERGESVWEKSESRSTSSTEGSSPRRDSSLKRSHTSAGERSSLTNLHWSDSGSSESLHASRSSHHGSRSSSLHGSFESLSKSPQRPRSSSTTSNTSQNAMLNLLSPIGTTRNPVTGALETDVDAAFGNAEDKNKTKTDTVEHNEETVDRTHLEFAQKACDILEFDAKKRDSSSDSQTGNGKQQDIAMDNVDRSDSQSNSSNDTNAKKGKDKNKKGFFKGKIFRK